MLPKEDGSMFFVTDLISKIQSQLMWTMTYGVIYISTGFDKDKMPNYYPAFEPYEITP
ncbi:MAG: hypothetical protein ABIJ59_13880 [Pseudomonadota bacterium]